MSTKPPHRSPRRDDADVALLAAPTEDRAGVRIVRARKGRIEVGEIRAAREGQPLVGELVKLHPRAGKPWLCDVETLYAGPEASAAGKTSSAPTSDEASAESSGERNGPSAIATEAYRANWERIFSTATHAAKRKRRGDSSMN